MKRVALVLRAIGLGNVLTSVPALRALREALPQHDFVLATSMSLLPVVRLAGCADRLIHSPDPRLLHPNEVMPEIAINLHGWGPESHVALRQTHPGRLVAFARPDLGIPGPRWDPDEHEVQRWCRLIEQSFAIRCDTDDLDLAEPMMRFGPAHAAVLHIGAGQEARRWPVAGFAAVARHLDRRGHQVVLTGSAEERPRALAVAQAAGLSPASVWAGRTGLAELASIVSRATLVVSGDTGVAHLATAYRRRSVTLFGPVSPSLCGPPPRPQHSVLWAGDPRNLRPGRPHGDRVDPLLASIHSGEVIDACERLVATVPA